MNREFYDKYYQKGGYYEIPVEIFNDLQSQLEQSNNKLEKAKQWIKMHSDENDYFGSPQDLLDILERSTNEEDNN